MNIALILSGGVGKRFAANLPKQYNLINGKPVIDYVIEACMKSKLTDKIIVVCDPSCKQFSKYLENDEIETVVNGKERYDSLNNGVKYIKEHYDCQNICILDAAARNAGPASKETQARLQALLCKTRTLWR
jgi:2-C-methyl-D-erythritol 4-phosphate cytidylyltransferase